VTEASQPSLHARPLREEEVDADPIAEFRRWYDEARDHVRMREQMVLATATPEGAPSARLVLLKEVDAEDGFVFYSGYESRKGRELAANPRAALLFYWDVLGRQVRVEGRVERLAAADSDAYWQSRPPGSRRSAAASRQSEPIESRAALERAVSELDEAPPRPERWGGYRLVPDEVELWQHRDDRLHDRLRYRREGAGWRRERLQP
jgi:pyridoxamine 5'-phosphate oxidase